MTLKVTEGHQNCRYSMSHISPPTIVVRLYLATFLRYYHHIYIVYLTASDLKKH